MRYMNGGLSPNLLFKARQFRIKMVFLIAQLFRRCLIAEHTNVLVMGSATSTLSSRKHRWHQWRRTKHRSSTSFLLQLLKACVKVKHLTCNLTQTATGSSGGAESNLFWCSCMSPQGQLQALNIATAVTPSSMYEPNQFVMNCGVIDPTAGPIRIYSPISQPQRRRQDLLLVRPTLDGAATIILSVCAMQSPSIKSHQMVDA